ncbi:MAG: zinc-binding dehydrogenase [Chloroflexi bacterium]|nr:zinc-binding dehydrogenase [Chloroflexota bacterium]
MKATYIAAQGGTDQFVYGEIPEPAIAPDEILVRVRACGVNRLDVFGREGSHGVRMQSPQHVLGLDLAGEVEDVGSYVAHTKRFKKGDRVLGVGSGGTYAEYARAPMDRVHLMPDWMSFEEAAAIPTVYAAAWRAIVVRARITFGEDALVMAAGSGVGTAAIQIAKYAGCRVLTTASSDAKLEKARALGADIGINYKEHPEFSKQVLEHTGGAGVDLIYEHIGQSVFDQCYRSLKRGTGRLVTNGVTSGHLTQLHLGQLWTREVSLIGSTMHPELDLPAIMKGVARKALRGVVDRVFPLKDAAEAHRVLESNDFFGKLVLVP